MRKSRTPVKSSPDDPPVPNNNGTDWGIRAGRADPPRRKRQGTGHEMLVAVGRIRFPTTPRRALQMSLRPFNQ
jgi:hypothetical protein